MKRRMPDLKDPRVRRSTIVVLIAAIGVVTALTASVLSLTSQNFFCAKVCHSLMKYDVAAYEKSSHANVQCVACHIPPNAASFMQHKVMALKELYMAVAGTYEWPINFKSELAEEIPNENCNNCHAVEKRKVTPSSGVIIDHKIHTDKGVKCASCHNRVGHPELALKLTDEQINKLKEEESKVAKEGAKKGAKKGAGASEPLKVVNGRFEYEDMISMEGCTRCHGLEANAKAPGRCELCHPKGFELKPGNHLVAAWMQFFKDKRADHGRMAKEAGGSKYCSQCHVTKFCQDCHGLKAMPHPESFKTAKGGKAEHGEIGTKSSEGCRKCHTDADFCTACHHKGYESGKAWAGSKGVPQSHPGVVNKAGAEGCFKCHDGRYCSSCHTQGTANPEFISRRR